MISRIEQARQTRIADIYRRAPPEDMSLRQNLSEGMTELAHAIRGGTARFDHANPLLERMVLSGDFDLIFSAQLYDGYIRTCYVLPVPHSSPETRMPYDVIAPELSPNGGIVTHTIRSIIQAEINSAYFPNTAILTVNQVQFRQTHTLTVGIIPNKAAIEVNPNVHSLLTQMTEMNAETIVR